MQPLNDEHRNYKDLLQHRGDYLPLPKIFNVFLTASSYGVYLPLVGRFFRRSFTLVCYALGQLHKKHRYQKMYRLLFQCLSGMSFRQQEGQYWWYLMRFAVAITQERQINWLIRDIVLEDQLILLGSLGPTPLKGYDVAYAFVGYSLWSFERGNILGALHWAEVAEKADETWGYPAYLYGWYGLFTLGVDSVSHFTRAVNIDWSFLQRMKQDKTCRAHPDVVHEVQRRTLVLK